MKFQILGIVVCAFIGINTNAQQRPLRDLGIEIGVFPAGVYNAITDVKGVQVGHTTIIEGDHIRTGVTTILPHDGNVFQEKVPAAIYIGNGFGKLMGHSQVKELGNLETPIILTNTLSVPVAANAVIEYTLHQKGNEKIRSVNAVVGETNDGILNDIRGRHVKAEHVYAAIQEANSGPVKEGNVGAGTGTICFGYKGGVGTASRVLPEALGGYTIGVLVQTNFGGLLEIAGVPVGKEFGSIPYGKYITGHGDGSCMMVVATDAPVDARNLERIAKRAMLGLAKTGGIASNGSGDYVIAFSTAAENRIPYTSEEPILPIINLQNSEMTPLFMATIEAVEESILNSLFAAKTMSGYRGKRVEALPIDTIKKIMEAHNRIKSK